jgi:hypothetical protein
VNRFLSFSEDRRRTFCEQAQEKWGFPPPTIEKDFWVCWTLKKLFSLSEWGARLTFKGGTSLSKGWALIERFSEDIDIVIDRAALGFGGDKAPDYAPSKKQIKKRLKALRKTSRRCVNETLLPLLSEVISHEMPGDLSWQLDQDPDDPDRQTLLFTYPTAFPDQLAYLRQVVKIELGARSDIEPTQEIDIHPYIADAFPDQLPQAHFSVRAVSPERTFWEKAMLLLMKKRFARRRRRGKRGWPDTIMIFTALLKPESAKKRPVILDSLIVSPPIVRSISGRSG